MMPHGRRALANLILGCRAPRVTLRAEKGEQVRPQAVDHWPPMQVFSASRIAQLSPHNS